MNYYNENNPKVAAWLRELIKKNLIGVGFVDERSIEDVTPDDLLGYIQCHFFAGIGGWSLALRKARWEDARPVWTGSCPCQPFSQAGKGKGFADERHLWPAWHWLIQQCKPIVVFGEQVAGKAGETWLDLVSSDLEGESYTFGAVATAACGVGAPHQRKRLYWVAHTEKCGKWTQYRKSEPSPRQEKQDRGRGVPGRLAYAVSLRVSGRNIEGLRESRGEVAQQENWKDTSDEFGDGVQDVGRVAESTSQGLFSCPQGGIHCEEESTRTRDGKLKRPGTTNGSHGVSGPTNGFWRDADWLFCRDGKWRAVGPGVFPLADGVPVRVVRLCGYGNAIVIPQAVAFIEAYMEWCPV